MRNCGPCKACCTLTRVFELSKPEGQVCAHIGEIGCSIYENRPPSCAGFACCWLASVPKATAAVTFRQARADLRAWRKIRQGHERLGKALEVRQ